MSDTSISDLTSGATDGTGSFDLLMRAVQAQLQQEYDDGRIVGAEYATVYLGAIQTALTVSSQFTLAVPKLNAEVDLYAQKLITEQAQTSDEVDDDDVGGVLGKQMALYQAQTDGFARDAEQKLLSIFNDSWIVRQTTDGDDAASAGIDNPTMSTIVDKAMEGIGLSTS